MLSLSNSSVQKFRCSKTAFWGLLSLIGTACSADHHYSHIKSKSELFAGPRKAILPMGYPRDKPGFEVITDLLALSSGDLPYYQSVAVVDPILPEFAIQNAEDRATDLETQWSANDSTNYQARSDAFRNDIYLSPDSQRDALRQLVEGQSNRFRIDREDAFRLRNEESADIFIIGPPGTLLQPFAPQNLVQLTGQILGVETGPFASPLRSGEEPQTNTRVYIATPHAEDLNRYLEQIQQIPSLAASLVPFEEQDAAQPSNQARRTLELSQNIRFTFSTSSAIAQKPTAEDTGIPWYPLLVSQVVAVAPCGKLP